MRADALENRRRILEAAEEVFSRQGVAAPIDDVAERAGVGVGTLYRNFPNKEALFEAIVVTRLEELLCLAQTSIEAEDAGAAFFSFVRAFTRKAASKQDLVDALSAAGIDIKSRCFEMTSAFEASVQQLLARAKGSGAVRPDVSIDEVLSLIIGACHATDRSKLDDVSRDRMTDVVCDGLRSRAS